MVLTFTILTQWHVYKNIYFSSGEDGNVVFLSGTAWAASRLELTCLSTCYIDDGHLDFKV